MRGSRLKHRLHKNLSDAFEREEEKDQKEPKRIIFLSVEGTVSEPQYFERLGKRIEQSDEAVFRIEVLTRMKSDGHSEPKHVIELLNEYMDILNEGPIPETWMKRLNEKYNETTIRQVISSPQLVKKELREEIYDELIAGGVNIEYRKYLKDISEEKGTTNNRDIFAVVIDREGDNGKRSRSAIKSCISDCKEKGYNLYLTNPCFEFWLLLHLCDVKVEYADRLNDLLSNKRVSSKHTFTSLEVSQLCGHAKKISQKNFDMYYYPKITQAIEHSKAFACELEDIIDRLGTNLPELMLKLDLKY